MEYGKITWTVKASTPDTGADVDFLPDVGEVQGFVRFTPETWVHKPTASWAVVETRYADITGDKLTHQGEDGIWLEASLDPLAAKPTWFWRVDFDLYWRGEPLDLPSKRFSLAPDEVIDLATILARSSEPSTARTQLGMVWADPNDAPPPETSDGMLWLKTNGDLLYYKDSAA